MSLLLRSRASFARPSNCPSKFPAALLQLPTSFRSFHASSRPQSFDAIIAPAHALFEGLHNFTGLPWAYTIPLAALTIRTLITLPISIHGRRISLKRREITSVLEAWNHHLRKAAIKEKGHLGPVQTNHTFVTTSRQKRLELYRRHGCETWKALAPPLTQLPIFLTAIESLRRMFGMQSGLLGLASASITGQDAADKSMTDWFEPTMSTEGALWFPDLTIADPMMLLPFMLSGSMLLNLKGGRYSEVQTAGQKRIRRIFMTIAVVMGPLCLQMPSGILVYWTSSMLFAFGQALVLDKIMPIKKIIVPCKPRSPLRIGRSMKL